MRDSYTVMTGYSDQVSNDPVGTAASIVAFLRRHPEIEFDTIVSGGLSGMLVAPIVASVMGKHMVGVRKPCEKYNSHASQAAQGTIGRRWIMIDDFVSSGATLLRLWNAIEDAVESANEPNWWTDRKPEEFVTEFVGVLQYVAIRDENDMIATDDESVFRSADKYEYKTGGVNRKAVKAKEEAARRKPLDDKRELNAVEAELLRQLTGDPWKNAYSRKNHSGRIYR